MKLSIKTICIICLSIIIAVLAVMNFNNYKQLNYYKTQKTDTEKQDTIKKLTSEVSSLRTKLEAYKKNNSKDVEADIKIFLSAYYDNKNSNTFTDKMNNLKPLMTDNGYASIDIYHDIDDPDAEESKNDYKYSSTINVKHFYYKYKNTDHAEALAVCDLSVLTPNGNSNSTILVSLNMVYNGNAKRWLVDNINYNNVVYDDFS